LHRLVLAEKAGTQPKSKTKAELESHAAGKDKANLESHAAGKSSTPPPRATKLNDKFDRKSALPVKEGKLDQDLYSSFLEKSLRFRLWDAVVSGKCTRCNGPHLRVACPKPRQGWEDDFEKDNFFTKPPPVIKKQVRVQLAGNSLNFLAPQILSVMSPLGRCLIDTCSDISIARRDVLRAVGYSDSDQSVLDGYLGGDTIFHSTGTLELERSDRASPVRLGNVYVVEPEMLPAGVVALLGVADIQVLGISLDVVLASPGCPWEDAVRLSYVQRLRRAFRRCFGFGPPPDRQAPPRHGAREPRVREKVPTPPVRPERTPIADADDEAGRALLEQTRARSSEEMRQRTANRVAELFREGMARKEALHAKKAAAAPQAHASSSVSSRFAPSTWPRKRTKFYAVRKGRKIGIFNTWEECERQTKGVSSEFKSFPTYEEASAYLLGRRLNFMAFRRSPKPPSSFVGGTGVRAPPSHRLRLRHDV
jgi:hypothetical protein